MKNIKMRFPYLLCVKIIMFTLIICIPSTWAHTGDESGGKQAEWPDTCAARFAKAFFKAYNTDGDDALRRFVKEHYSEKYLKETQLEDELASHLQLQKIAGKMVIHSALGENDFTVSVITRSKLFGWMKFEIELSPEPPHDPIGFSGGPTSPPEKKSAKGYNGWNDLGDLLDMIHRDSGAPGMAASIVQGDTIVDKAVTGVRCIDGKERIRISDRFHLGSVSKVFTGTMIGKLLDKKVLRWEMTIGEILNNIRVREEYRNVTLGQLLGHCGGVPTLPAKGEFADGFPTKTGQSSTEARALLVQQVLNEEPVNPNEYSYSNAGYVVAAYMAERVTKRSWEDLMRTFVFKPIILQTIGFGWPADKDHIDQPRGHYGAPPGLEVQKIGEYMLGDMDYIGPAGNLHCSIEDLARFARFLLRVLDNKERKLKAETVPRFWRVGKTDNGKRRFCFFGSGATFFAMIALYPENDVAVVAIANSGLHNWPSMTKLRDTVYERMIKLHEEPLDQD